jgi:tRNA nucleotidyltransferase/poly(A) polymerase
MNNFDVSSVLRWLWRLLPTEHVYLVGGAVRDYLTNGVAKDIDLVLDTSTCPVQMEVVVATLVAAGADAVLNNYGVAIVTLPAGIGVDSSAETRFVVEIAMSRKESYGGKEGKGYKPSSVEPATLLEDLQRRDFTVNTLLIPLRVCAQGLPPRHEAIDLTGRGCLDLLCMRLDTVADPVQTFLDDPSRMLRMVKFELRGYTPDDRVYAALALTSESLKKIPHQAVTTHFLGLLEDNLARGSVIVLATLARVGLLRVVKEIIAATPAARECVRNWAGGQSVQLQKVFASYELPTASWFARAAKDLSAEQLHRVCHFTSDSRRWFDVYAQPGIVLDTERLAAEFDLHGEQISRIQRVARELLVQFPASLLALPERFTTEVRSELLLRGKEPV